MKPKQAKILVVILGLLVFAVDMVIPADLDWAIFYCFVVVLCAWTRSLIFLWSAAGIFIAASLPGLLLSPPPVTGPVSWVDWANRLFGMSAVLLVTVFIHLRMNSFYLMEEVIKAREKAEQGLRDSEAQLKLAQAAGGIGSWQWNPAESTYHWSEECYDIFGIDPAEKSFAAKWISAIHSADSARVNAAMTQSTEQEGFELEYRYEHPSRGTRWVHTRARVFKSDMRAECWYGICQDVTDRKQAEALLRQSRSILELLVEERTSELHKLSAELLHAQDEERRKIARELHDSFGQYLASLKINLDLLTGTFPGTCGEQNATAKLLSDCLDIVLRCILETRTLSYLLHPPLLEEAGFASAARWYVEGFAKRSKIEVKLEVSSELGRLPPVIELALFRILQESLTNVHRYSGSSVVDIGIDADAEEAVLTIQDYGRGIHPDILSKFREHGTGVGVGLSGMRERMKELGGRLELSSDAHGTIVSARVPLLVFIPKQVQSTKEASFKNTA